MQNISGYGTKVVLRASVTYPQSVFFDQFADDADAMDLPVIEIAGTAMGLNGDLIGWSTPKPIQITWNVIPQSFTDRTLAILFEANRVGRGKTGARDRIDVTVLLPDFSPLILTNGFTISGMPGNSIASSGRLKTKPYTFSFENKAGGL